MKIRITGTMDECAVATAYYRGLEKDANVKYVQVSAPYANRGSSTLFRVYVDIEYYSVILETASAGVPMPWKQERNVNKTNSVCLAHTRTGRR